MFAFGLIYRSSGRPIGSWPSWPSWPIAACWPILLAIMRARACQLAFVSSLSRAR